MSEPLLPGELGSPCLGRASCGALSHHRDTDLETTNQLPAWRSDQEWGGVRLNPFKALCGCLRPTQTVLPPQKQFTCSPGAFTVAEIQPLNTEAEQNLRDRVQGEREESRLSALPGQGGHGSGLRPPNPVSRPGGPEGCGEGFIAVVRGCGAEKEQGVCRACVP